MEENFKQKLHHIRCFAFDVDGVLTNGQVHITDDGKLLRSMNIKDGYAMQLAIKHGFEIIIISGAQSDGAVKRLAKLGIDNIHMGVENKHATLTAALLQKNIRWDEVLYMGDDVPDMEAMKECRAATCPSDAMMQVKEICQYVSLQNGGEGCVRDVIEQVLRLQKKWS